MDGDGKFKDLRERNDMSTARYPSAQTAVWGVLRTLLRCVRRATRTSGRERNGDQLIPAHHIPLNGGFRKSGQPIRYSMATEVTESKRPDPGRILGGWRHDVDIRTWTISRLPGSDAPHVEEREYDPANWSSLI